MNCRWRKRSEYVSSYPLIVNSALITANYLKVRFKTMIRLTVLFLLALSFSALAQTKAYVCPPCNNTCDNKVYDHPGRCSSCHMELVEKSALSFPNLSVNEFCARITANPNVVLLDVRSAGEFEGSSLFRSTYGHFKNAININIDDLEERIAELSKYKDREVLVYCSHSVRSPRAAMILNQHDFKNVKNLAGGVSTIVVRNDDCLKKNYVVH
jgi:rhodanese-related sulfurtransferase